MCPGRVEVEPRNFFEWDFSKLKKCDLANFLKSSPDDIKRRATTVPLSVGCRVLIYTLRNVNCKKVKAKLNLATITFLDQHVQVLWKYCIVSSVNMRYGLICPLRIVHHRTMDFLFILFPMNSCVMISLNLVIDWFNCLCCRHLKRIHKETYERYQHEVHALARGALQSSIDSFLSSNQGSTSYGSASPQQKLLLSSLVNDVIVNCGMPISVVDYPHFRSFLKQKLIRNSPHPVDKR